MSRANHVNLVQIQNYQTLQIPNSYSIKCRAQYFDKESKGRENRIRLMVECDEAYTFKSVTYDITLHTNYKSSAIP